VLSTALAAAMCLCGLSPHAPRPVVDEQLRLELVALLTAAAVAKYVAFAACVFPATTEESYGVPGVSQATKERGRSGTSAASISTHGAARGLGSHPSGLPPPPFSSDSSFASAMSLDGLLACAYQALIILTLGLWGRQVDGTYSRHANHYIPLQDPYSA
jgi:hypothetical protein